MEASKRTLSAAPHPANFSAGSGTSYFIQRFEKSRGDTDCRGGILRLFLFIGPINMIFENGAFFMMLDALDCWRNPALFPHRLVRGAALHPVVRHRFWKDRRGRCLALGIALGEHARICPAPAAVSAVSGRRASSPCDSVTGGEGPVCPQAG